MNTREYPVQTYPCPECRKPTPGTDPSRECERCADQIEEQTARDERAELRARGLL